MIGRSPVTALAHRPVRQLTVDGDCRRVECRRVLRSLPGKRMVYAGKLGDESVVFKFYLHPKRALQHWRRELDGISAFSSNSIDTPELLYAGEIGQRGEYVIVTREIANISTAASAIQSIIADASIEARRDELISVLTMLVRTVAAHHSAGLLQEDLHLDNFILDDLHCYSLDGDSVRICADDITPALSLNNLALLLAQLVPAFDRFIPLLSGVYCEARGTGCELFSPDALRDAVKSRRDYRKKHFLKKIFRQCTEFHVDRAYGCFRVVANRYKSGQLMDGLTPEKLAYDADRDRMLKSGNTCTVWQTAIGGQRYVVKRYNMKNFRHRLGRSIRRTRAAVSWKNAHCLRFLGIDTPFAVALVEERHGPFRGRAWLLSEYVEGVGLDQRLAAERDADRRDILLHRVAQMLASLREQGICHGDFKASNFLVGGDMTPFIIDLDAMRQMSGSRFRKAWARDIRRFLKNWSDHPETRQAVVAALARTGISSDDFAEK